MMKATFVATGLLLGAVGFLCGGCGSNPKTNPSAPISPKTKALLQMSPTQRQAYLYAHRLGAGKMSQPIKKKGPPTTSTPPLSAPGA